MDIWIYSQHDSLSVLSHIELCQIITLIYLSVRDCHQGISITLMGIFIS